MEARILILDKFSVVEIGKIVEDKRATHECTNSSSFRLLGLLSTPPFLGSNVLPAKDHTSNDSILPKNEAREEDDVGEEIAKHRIAFVREIGKKDRTNISFRRDPLESNHQNRAVRRSITSSIKQGICVLITPTFEIVEPIFFWINIYDTIRILLQQAHAFQIRAEVQRFQQLRRPEPEGNAEARSVATEMVIRGICKASRRYLDG